MIPVPRRVPVDDMAFDLSQHLPCERATPDRAALLLLRIGYRGVDVGAGLDAALRLAGRVTARAASDRPWALALGRIRDVAAAGIILVGLLAPGFPA